MKDATTAKKLRDKYRETLRELNETCIQYGAESAQAQNLLGKVANVSRQLGATADEWYILTGEYR